VNDPRQAAEPSRGDNRPMSGPLWTSDSDVSVEEEEQAADLGTALANLGFIRAALRRSRWFWCATAVLGLVAGIGFYVARPPAYQASATVLLPPATYPNAILDDQEVAQSRTVAGEALHQLGLRQTPASFLTQYTVEAPTGRVLIITARAKSGEGAVREANALAAAFLTFQAHLLQVQDQLVTATFGRRISQGQQTVDSLAKQIKQLSGQSLSPAQHSDLANLRAEHTGATNALAQLKQADAANQAAMQTTTTTTVQGSRVLDPAVGMPQSRLKHLLEYALIGLILGLALGAGIVVVRALVSDRPRRRDDVARALGAPVKLSVGKVRVGSSRDLHAMGGAEVRRVVAHLGRSVQLRSRGAAALAVVPADDPEVAAICLMSLACRCAERGLRVVVTDLCDGTPAARLANVSAPGVHRVSLRNLNMVVAVPDSDDVAPVGPLRRGPLTGQGDPANEQLTAACASADVLLTLASLDPSLGGEHLAGWARGAVVMVTAGRSSAERIHSVGEMIRLAGVDQVSAVLLGADKADESLGMFYAPVTVDADSLAAASRNGALSRPGSAAAN
jgi:capsular polysaccharide biosynthesis protein